MKEWTMPYEEIELIREEHIALIYLNRPKALNALTETMKQELIQALRETEEDEEIKVLILTGRGRGFCAGADLNRFIEAQKESPSQKRRFKFGSLDFPRAFIHFPKPIIAAINGPAYGFGFTVTLTCDIRLASEKAKFSCAFVRIGVTPEFGSTFFLPRLIGYGKAAELIFTARPFDAREALELGAIDRLVPHRRLILEAKKMAKQIASFPIPAIQKSKEILRQGIQSTLDQVLQIERSAFIECMETEEHRRALEQLLNRMNFKAKEKSE